MRRCGVEIRSHPADKARYARFLGGEGSAGEHQILGEALAQDARETLRRADRAALCLRRAEARLRRGHDEVAGAGNLDARADRRAVHERDAGHGQRFERLVGGKGFEAPLADPGLALPLPLF